MRVTSSARCSSESDVVERVVPDELEVGEPQGDLVEPGAVLLERRQALVRLREHRRDVDEDVLHPVHVDGDHVAALGDRDDERLGLLRDALGRAVARARLHREDRRVRHQLDVRPAILVASALRTIAPSIFATW